MISPSASPSQNLSLTDRLSSLDREIRATQPGVCAERALLVTEYFRDRRHRRQAMAVQKAEALCHVLRRKQVRIYPHELLVGCPSSYRVGGNLYPELHGVAVMEDIFRFDRRPLNPMRIARRDRLRLLTQVLPFWAPRMMTVRGKPLPEVARFLASQLFPTSHLINESGGISHFAPDYAALVAQGTDGFRGQVDRRLAEVPAGSPEHDFLRSVRLVCDGLDDFADGYRCEAERLAKSEPDPARAAELRQIAAVCGRVPRSPAQTLQEALQAILFAQIALNLESLDNAICPGRLDQILWPYYQRERSAGTLLPEQAYELLGCFALKLCEIVPVFSQRITRFHGGLFNGQVVVVGGVDAAGGDATNELSYLLLDLMDRMRTRQPNYHARLHTQSPLPYRRRIAAALAAGAVSPAVYNDQVIVPLLESRGISLEHARDYATVGCVEPVAAGKSFLSTDAALFNLPLCLELALGRGRRFGHRLRSGASTPPAEGCRSIDEVIELFRLQLEHSVGKLLAELGSVEQANIRWHPTPLSSMLLCGCIDAARDASSGGARYNGSGIQGVGVVEVGDSLAALEAVVFRHRHATMAEVVAACARDFAAPADQALRARLRSAPKYGNDDPAADHFVARVMELYAGALAGKRNRRGGEYAAGFYSVTCHQAFGEVVGALPSGRGQGEPFSSGLSPSNGFDRKGPTAALCSQARLPLHLAQNGLNFNLKLAPFAAQGEQGVAWLQALLDGGFAAGCMQMQVNVLDPAILVEARDHPGRYPGLLVRVSGYSAYFDDLSPAMKQEIIDRTLWAEGAW